MLLAASGCFEIHHGQSKTAESIEKTEPIATPSGSFTASMKTDGSVVSVTVKSHCTLVEQQTVKITTSYDKVLDEGAANFLTALGLIGSLPITGGVVLLADSPNVYDNDPHARLYNPTGKATVIGAGVALTVIGVGMIILPITNAIHAAGSEDETTTTTRQGRTLRADAPCEGAVAVPARTVVGKSAQGQTITIGTTDAEGHMTMNLKQVLGQPNIFGGGPVPISLGVYVDNQYVGEVQTGDVMQEILRERSQQDESTWKDADPSACAAQHTEQVCQRVRQYLQLFPQGAHAREAQEMISKLTGGGPGVVIAQNPNANVLDNAVASAQAASAKAAQKILDAAQAAQQKALLKAQDDAQRAGKVACQEECKRVCEAPLKTGGSPKDAGECRTSCIQEACP